MKTTHQIAKELLALPDVKLIVEGWCSRQGYELTAKMTQCDPSGTAILVQKCVDDKVSKETQEWAGKNTRLVWLNPTANDQVELPPKGASDSKKGVVGVWQLSLPNETSAATGSERNDHE